MSAFCKVTTCRAEGGTAANAAYILRERACERWEAYNFPDHAIFGATALERKRSAVAEIGEAAEEGVGQRKSFRVVLSFERDIPSEQALRLAREFLVKSPFVDNPALLAVHRNTEHVHVHAAVVARKTDGLKIQLDRTEYRSLDKIWARIYEREMTHEMKREPERAPQAERERSAAEERAISLEAWRRRYGQLRRQGLSPEEIKAQIGERPHSRTLPVEVVHIRRNEQERTELLERVARRAPGLSHGRGGTEREVSGERTHERRIGHTLPGTGSGPGGAGGNQGPAAERTRGRILDYPGPGRGTDRAPDGERQSPERTRADGRGLSIRMGEFVGRLPQLDGDPEQVLVREIQRVGSQLAATIRIRLDEFSRQASGPGRVRAHADGLVHGLSGRLGELSREASGVNFKTRVFPVLRCCERYLEQLPHKFGVLRDRFQELYHRTWERFLGRRAGFREELELTRQDPPLRREKKLELGKVLSRGLFKSL